MRNPSSLCAAALSFALAAPALAIAPPHQQPAAAPQDPATQPFDRTKWDVVIPAPDVLVAADIKKACPDGTLASPRAAVDEKVHNGWTRSGFNTQIPLYCVRMDAAHTTATAIENYLELTVYYPFLTDAPNFVLNRGKYLVQTPGRKGQYFSEAVEVRPATGAELTYVAPAPAAPAAAPATQTASTRHRTAHHHATAQGLTDGELGWMTRPHRLAYLDKLSPLITARNSSGIAELNRKARAEVRTDLRDDGARKQYAAALATNNHEKIEAFFQTPPARHYSGDEIALTPAELAALDKVANPAPNAHAAYDAAVLAAKDNGKVTDPDEVHVELHAIVVQYRALVPTGAPGGGGPSPTGPDFSTVKTKEDFEKLSADQKKALCATIGAAATPPSADVQAACSALARGDVPPPPDSLIPPSHGGSSNEDQVDLQHITTKDQFGRLDPDQKRKLCSMIGAAQGDTRGNSCGGAAANTDDAAAQATQQTTAMAQCKAANPLPPDADPKDGKALAAQQAAINACVSKANPACVSTQGKGGAAPRATTDILNACEQFARIDGGQHDSGNHAAASVPSPTDQNCVGKDGKPCPTKDAPGPDKNFWTNTSNGIAFGLTGLILASFLGGPGLMLAVGLAAGVGGYFLSKSINNPPPDAGKKS